MGMQQDSSTNATASTADEPLSCKQLHITAVDHTLNEPKPPIKEAPPPPCDYPSKPQINGSKLTMKKKKKMKMKRVLDDDAASASSSSSNSIIRHHHHNHLSQRGIRIASNRRIPTFYVRRSSRDVDAIAFPLGMSIAAVVAQILERKDLTSEKTSVDHLSVICTSAVRESLSNVFGDKFDPFVRNFEKSFGSTLSTLSLIRSSSIDNVIDCCPSTTPTILLNKTECSSTRYDVTDFCTKSAKRTFGTREHFKMADEIESNRPAVSRNRELSLHGHMNQQLACTVSNTRSYLSNHSMLSTIEKSVVEQTRANDLKSLEIGLIMKKLQLKETQLALNSDLNFLERCKLSLGISRTSFKAEKFKNHLEETRHSELLKTCADFLVADLLIMSGCLGCGVYAFSYDKLHQLTKSCSPSPESKSWWIPKPMASFNSGLQTLNCHVQVYSRMLFGLLMILAIAYVLVQRAGISRHAMPITFIVLLLGVVCGFAGKLCVDTLGGDGYHWLMYWEALCMLHFFANVFTPFLFYILNGAVQVSEGTKRHTLFPCWIRRWLFYLALFLLPVFCGLFPFASPRLWWEEYLSKLIRNHLLATAYGDDSDDGGGFHG